VITQIAFPGTTTNHTSSYCLYTLLCQLQKHSSDYKPTTI